MRSGILFDPFQVQCVWNVLSNSSRFLSFLLLLFFKGAITKLLKLTAAIALQSALT